MGGWGGQGAVGQGTRAGSSLQLHLLRPARSLRRSAALLQTALLLQPSPLFLLFHSPVLKPDFHLTIVQASFVNDLQPLFFGDVRRQLELSLQRHRLTAKISLAGLFPVSKVS